MRLIVRQLLHARKWTQAELAARLDTTQVTVSRWLAGSEPRGDKRDVIRRLAAESGIIDENYGGAHGRHMIAVMGHVGAGAEIDSAFEQLPPEGIEQIELPYPLPDGMIGFCVRGDSMLPKYDDGEILVVEREQPSSVDRMLGEIAVVRIEDGRRLVKRIMPGPKPHTFNLESINSRTIVGARIAWASPVRMVIPSVGLRRIVRKVAAKDRRAGAKGRR